MAAWCLCREPSNQASCLAKPTEKPCHRLILSMMDCSSSDFPRASGVSAHAKGYGALFTKCGLTFSCWRARCSPKPQASECLLAHSPPSSTCHGRIGFLSVMNQDFACCEGDRWNPKPYSLMQVEKVDALVVKKG